MLITLEFLREKNARKNFTAWFAGRFKPSGACYKEVIYRLLHDDQDLSWLFWLFEQTGSIEPPLIYEGEYVGKRLIHAGPVIVAGSLNLCGSLVAAGRVKAQNINVKGSIYVCGDLVSGKDIVASRIRAAGNVYAEACIVASHTIEASGNIIAGWDIVAGNIESRKGGIRAEGGAVSSKEEICARESVFAEKEIVAGENISSARGCLITSGNIISKHNITAGQYICAGGNVASWFVTAAKRPERAIGNFYGRHNRKNNICKAFACPIFEPYKFCETAVSKFAREAICS